VKTVWRIDEGFKGVSAQENELAVGLGHRKYPGYNKKNFVNEIRKLGIKPHKKIIYTPNPLKASRDYCIITDNFFKLRFIWLFFVLWIMRYKMIAVLLEPYAIKSWTYQFVKKYKFFFHCIVTHDKESFVYHGNKSIFLPIAAPTLQPVSLKIGKRKKLCTYLYNSRKEMTEGHRIRRNFADIASNFDDKCHIFSTKFGLSKSEFMFDTYFAIVIQNSRKDWYFSDQILDCFACGVVPIYYGSKGYKEFFDERGVIEINDLGELQTILSNLTDSSYYEKMESIKANFQTVKEFYDIDTEMINKVEAFLIERKNYR